MAGAHALPGCLGDLPPDLGRADAILIVGANPAVQQPIAFDSHVRPAVNDGAALIHVDPRRTETTRLATHHLAPRPGTDAAVISALTARLVDSGAVDREFVDARTTGFERYRAELANRETERALAETDVSGSTVEPVVDVLAEADRTAVVAGTGMGGPGGRATAADALLRLLRAGENLVTPDRGRGGGVDWGVEKEESKVIASAKGGSLLDEMEHEEGKRGLTTGRECPGAGEAEEPGKRWE
jgi:formate dehydrogenase major subunit